VSARLIPPIDALTEPYWEAARRQELVMQRCENCDQWQFPPRANCAGCGSSALAWRPVDGGGTVYSYTIARRPPHPVFAGQCPLAIAIIELEEGLRMMSNVVGCDAADVHVGMAVRVVFEPIDDSEVVLPVFAPA
jgi:uncharacterized OB-fold protein